MPHKRFAIGPNDLRGVCIAFGKTLSVLSERTGIPEDELLRFDDGTHALSACDRYAVIRELCKWSRPVPPQTASHRLTLAAHTLLISEVEDEHREEDEELEDM